MVTEKAQKALEKVAVTLERYRKNRTLVPPEELAGKYKKPFEKLKQQLKAELEEYLRLFLLEGLRIFDDDEGSQVIDQINQALAEARIGRQIGQAAFQEFDLGKIRRIALEGRRRVEEIYKAYFDRHTCLYAASASWDPDNPQPPLLYNDIVDKFWSEETGEWITREKPPGDAILIFVRENKTTEQKENNHEQTGERKEI